MIHVGKRRLALAIAAALAASLVTSTAAVADGAASSAREAAATKAAVRLRLPDAARTSSAVLEDGSVRTRYTYSAATISGQRRTWTANSEERATIDQYVDALMRRGKTVDRATIDVVPFEVPDKMVFNLVQDRRDQVGDFIVDIVEKPGQDGFGMNFLVSYHNPETAAKTGTDAGFDAASGNNATERGEGTRTVYFSPDYASANGVRHWVTQSYEKWQSNTTRRDWGYNSYATFDAANADWDYSAELVDATIRARPYKGYKDRVTGGPYDYEPRPQEVCRDVADVGINIGAYASLNIPVMNCYSGQEIYPEGNEHSMGTAWYGSTTAQRYLDFSFEFQAASSTTTPIMSDYIWMTIDYCSIFETTCGFIWHQDNNKWHDGGWS